jgi:BirA family biotin operon repressor/biotin-[acetyl-CoA-carboxylase] ligase
MIAALSEMDLKQKEAILQRYRNDCITLGKDISLVRGDTVRHGHAVDIDSEGALLVRFADGSAEAVSSGEVSIRGMYGYV